MRWTLKGSRVFVIAAVFLLVGWGALLSPPAISAETTLTIGGTGTATPLLEQLATHYQSREPTVSVRIISPPMGSNGSIRALLAGAIDLAVTGKPLADGEIALGGRFWALGRTPFVLATVQKNPHSGLSLAQLAAIYSGRVVTWPDGSPIRLILRTPMESDNLALRKLSPLMNNAVDAALARPGLLSAENDLQNLDLLEKTPGSLGATSFALVQSRHARLRLLAIEGVEPNLSNLSSGRYPYQKTLYMAQGPTVSPAAQHFLNFVLSAAGKEILQQSGYLPVDQHP